MDIKKYLKQILFRNSNNDMKSYPERDQILKLIGMIENTREEEYSCEDTFNLIDQYVEMVERKEDAEKILPLVHHHLTICPDCREEMEAVLRILESYTTKA